MTRHDLETKFTSEIVGSDTHAKLAARVSIDEILDSLLPLPYRVLDNTTSGENWLISSVMSSIRTWIWGQSVPTFRFTRWCEIQAQIENEYARTPEVLSRPVEDWPEINPELCRLLYLQDCRAGRHTIEGLDYVDPVNSPAAALGRKGGQSRTQAKTQAARENGRRGGRPRRNIDWSEE